MLEGLLARRLPAARRAEIEATLECPPLPDALAYLWVAFCRLSARRTSGFSINPISWSELDAFIRLTGVRLSPWEIRIIEELDDLFRRENLSKRD